MFSAVFFLNGYSVFSITKCAAHELERLIHLDFAIFLRQCCFHNLSEWQIVLGRWWRWRALIHRTSSLIIGVFRKRWRWWRLLRLNRKHLHIINKKFCNIPFNSSAIIITPSSYLSFQIQLVSLMDILLNNIGKTTPNNNIMPFSSFRNLCSIGKGITFSVVAKEKVATLEPASKILISGSLPTCPISINLFKLMIYPPLLLHGYYQL